jgi:F-type H+-transporting ATPase subunit c
MLFFVTGCKIIASGIASLSLIGSGVGIGLVFSALVDGIGRNPDHVGAMLTYAILGFALAEAVGLFGLMMSFLLLYGSF